MKTRLLIAYDGTDYSGWQIQPNGVSIQGTMEEALQTLLRRPTRLIGSGRRHRRTSKRSFSRARALP